MSESEERKLELFEAQNEMISSALELFMDTLPSIADSVQKIANAVAGGTSAPGSNEGGAEKEDGNESSKAITVDLSKLSESLGGLSKGLLEFNILAGGGRKFVRFIEGLTKALTLDGEIEDPAGVAELYTAFGKSIDAVGGSIGKMSTGMVLFAIANALGGPKAFTEFFDQFFTPERIKTLSGDEAKTFGQNLVAISGSMKTMAMTLMLLTPAMIIAIPGVLLLVPVMAVVNFAIEHFGSPEAIEHMEGFTKSMTYFGVGLGTFVIAALLTRLIEPEDILMLGLIVGAYALTSIVFAAVMNLTGGPEVSEGFAKGMAFFSLGLIAFELAALGTRILEYEDILKVTLIAGSMALVTLILSAVSDRVEKGAAAMLIVAGALIVTELAIWMIDVLDIQTETYLKAAAMVITLAGAAFIAGIKGDSAIKGAAAMAIVGVSLIIAVVGVKMAAEVEWEDLGKGAAIITGLGLAAVGVGFAGPMAIQGAVAMLIIGASLIVAAEGVKLFADIEWEDLGKAASAVAGLGVAAAGLGFVGPLALLGSAVALSMGAALLVIGKGIEKFIELDIDYDKLAGKDGIIPKLLNSLIVPFADLGSKYAFSSLTSFLTGSNPVSEGINMAKGMGDVLVSIAKGVKAFSKLEFKDSEGNVVTMASDDFDKVATNLEMVITCVSKAFIAVGEDNQYDIGGDMGSLGKGLLSFANNLTGNTPLQNAIRNFSGIGEVLNGIASGLSGFAKLNFGKDKNGKDITLVSGDLSPEGTIATNIKNAIVVVAQAFTDAWKVINPGGNEKGIVGAAKNLWNGNFMAALDSLGDTPLEKAIGSFMGISDISKGIIDIVDKLGKDAGGIDSAKIKTNISNVISGMTGGLVGINSHKIEDLTARKDYVKDISNSIVNIAKNSDGLKESADSMERICKALDDSMNVIKDLADEKLKNVKEIFDALVALEEKESGLISDKMNKFGDMANGVNDNKNANNPNGSSGSGSGSEGSADTSDSTPDIKNVKSGEQLKAILEQMSSLYEKIKSIDTKLAGTLTVNMEDDGGLPSYRKY